MWDDTTSYLYFLPEHIIPNIINGLLSPLLWKYREQSTLQRHLHINDHSSPAFSIGNTLKMKHLALVITISICQLCYGSLAPIDILTPPPLPANRPWRHGAPLRRGFKPRSLRTSQNIQNTCSQERGLFECPGHTVGTSREDSKEACARRCHENPSCNSWLYERPNIATNPYQYTECKLKATTRCSRRQITDDKGCTWVKGNMQCGRGSEFSRGSSCAKQNLNTQKRKGVEVTQDVQSWKECSKLCRRKPHCRHWTWGHENAGQWAHKCYTMSGYGYTNFDTNVVSGDRYCGGGNVKSIMPSCFLLSLSVFKV